jgi:hypothetical protein
MTVTTPAPLNGVDTPTLFATLGAVRNQPELARFQFRSTTRWIGGTHNRSTISDYYGAGGEHRHAQDFTVDVGGRPRAGRHRGRRPAGLRDGGSAPGGLGRGARAGRRRALDGAARGRDPRGGPWRGTAAGQKPQRPGASLVREGGVEPPRPFGHTDLNRARLPIPPLAPEAGSGYPTAAIGPKPVAAASRGAQDGLR